MFRVLESLGWEVPDWIVVPGGNLGNSSAFGKAFAELRKLGLIDRVPRLAVINAAGTLAGLGPAGVVVAPAWDVPADVVIDFSLPEAVGGIVAACVARNLPLVVATTGLEDAERQAIAEAAREIPILQSPSMSLAVNIAMDLVGRAGGPTSRSSSATIATRRIRRAARRSSSAPLSASRCGRPARCMPARAGPALGPPTRSATTPCGRATIPASTRSSSAWTGSRSP